ncbi:tripartite tricarboxylate transporter substrate binding protein [Candidimonas sp. SYP-B2681]|uniref:tripartite tricarboxylate transporter substrate binding protein n=1 Tax=Candidimonas sp. SYP-B2681 TaxID=2497686 RepID=UPI000F87F78A|nr:tripartite tricarboxylate transporter substrate binding protein [Candidimonas sp. SYP-B2681]RTZ41657.1 tripartite tricarboxylate transporter substrate binding protein [Candidimonas sp. SYP-B2681]
MMKFIQSVLAVALLTLTGTAIGQSSTYPNKPIRLVVGFPAGGASDVAARAVAEKMSAQLGQPIIVENKPGAASNIASDAVAKAAPDGYTILFGTISLAINGSLYKKLSYDPSRDLIPVSHLSSAPFMLVVNPSSPIKSVGDLIAAGKKADSAHPIYYASAGNGSGAHLFTELLANRAGIALTHVPYRGAAPAMADVLGGQVPLTFDNIITTLPLIQAGKLRALAVSSKQRSSAAPDIPTLDEQGVAGYDSTSWFGLFLPAGTPAPIVTKLNQAAAEAVKTPQVSATLRGVGAEPVGSSVEAFQAFFKAEVEKWADVVRRAKVEVN